MNGGQENWKYTPSQLQSWAEKKEALFGAHRSNFQSPKEVPLPPLTWAKGRLYPFKMADSPTHVCSATWRPVAMASGALNTH